VPDVDRLQIVRDCYRAYETGDEEMLSRHLSDDFTFYTRSRNTEVMTFDGDKIARTEVYFGWNVE
jgi:ketosteroid isomerase-like protein